MAIVKIVTVNNVEIEYEVAGIGDRAIATLIDWIIMFAYLYIVFQLIERTSLRYSLSTTMQVIFYLPLFMYHLLCELFLDGQSFGKKAMRIKVVMMDASHPAFVNYFLRWIITPLEFLFGFGVIALIVCAANGKGQRLGDIAAGTTVIRLKPKATINDTLYQPELDLNYVVRFPEVVNLSDKDMSLVKQVQKQIYKKPPEQAHYFAEEAKTVICKKLNIQTDMSALDFVDVVIRDYNHLATMQG
jgi:uncharacterized RDD family membrane protein YckC